MVIDIDLSDEALATRLPVSRRELASWLSENGSSIEAIESDIEGRGGSNKDILTGLAIMDIELETAAELARSRDINGMTRVLANTMTTKDFVYGKIADAYGGFPEVLSSGIVGNLAAWRDYIMQRFDGGKRRCELLLTI